MFRLPLNKPAAVKRLLSNPTTVWNVCGVVQRKSMSQDIEGDMVPPSQGFRGEPHEQHRGKDAYLNQVTLMGTVCSEPYSLMRMGETIGFSINMRTINTFMGRNGQVVQKTYHDVVCYKRDFYELCEELSIGDRVFLQGCLVNRFGNSSNERDDEERLKTEIKALVIQKLSD